MYLDGSISESAMRSSGQSPRGASIKKYRVKLIERREIAQGTMAFDFSRPSGFVFRGGQAINVALIHPSAIDEKGSRRTFSIASGPHDPRLTIAMRMRDSAFKRTLRNLPLGSDVQIDGPTGRFVLEERGLHPAVFIAGGIGITPFMSMIKEAFQMPSPRPITLFYSNSSPAAAAFLNDLTAMAYENCFLEVVPTVSAPESVVLGDWEGERGLIDLAMLSRHVPNLQEAEYYIAGPSGMVSAMETLITGAGVPPELVHTDRFSGY